MANIFDYLNWRGDVPFPADPFNEVDNLILANLSYTDLEDIVPSDGTVIPLSVIRDLYFETHDKEALKKNPSFLAKPPLLMDEMLSGPRFRDLTACCYINNVNDDKRFQISAVTFLVGDGTIYVAFRGTDNSLTGWKEDFDLSYITETPGQKLAVQYLEKIASVLPYPIRVGGHSKGGNFAVYASSFCDPVVQDRIIIVYSDDGPGFLEDVTRSAGYLRILPKVTSIIPDTSIIGLLLSSLSKHHVVKSTASGIMQHDGFSWCINRNQFVPAELSETGKIMNRTLDSWISRLDDDTRRSFTDTVFTILEATGKDTVSEISHEKMKSMEKMIGSMPFIPKEKQAELLRLAGQLLQIGGQAVLEQLPDALGIRKDD